MADGKVPREEIRRTHRSEEEATVRERTIGQIFISVAFIARNVSFAVAILCCVNRATDVLSWLLPL